MLTLKNALETGQLDAFVLQAEKSELLPIEDADFDAALGKIVKSPQSEDQTSRSALDDGLTGT